MATDVPINIIVSPALWALAAAAAVVVACLLARKIRLRLPAAATAVWTLAILYFVAFSAVTLARYYGMATHGLDLGYYGNAIYQFARGHPFATALIPPARFLNHFAPLLAVFAPFTYIFPEPAYLLPIQSLFLAAGIPLLYYLGKPEAGPRWPAAALAASFALSPALHGANFYDFHPRALAVPLVLAAFLFFHRKRFWPGIICAVLLALAQDELALHAVALAAYGGFAAGRRRAGLVVAAALAVYFAGVCCILYPKLTYARGAAAAHYAGYFTPLAYVKGKLDLAAALSAKTGYFAALALPLAAFLPAAGPALFALATPLLVPALSTTANVFQIGWQYPLSVLPFIYGVAALGLRRLSRGDPGRRRRLLLAAASVFAVAFQLAFIAHLAPTFYRPNIDRAFPTAHENGLAGAAARVPADIALYAEDAFAARLAHRRNIYLAYFPLNHDVPAAGEALIIDRRRNAAAKLNIILKEAASLGLGLKAFSADYAYFEKGPERRSPQDLFRTWYGTVEEWQCSAPAGKKFVADPRAHDGRAMLSAGRLSSRPRPGAVYPPGEYRFSFFLRAAADEFCHALITARATDADDGRPGNLVRKDVDIIPGEDYRPYRVRLSAGEPFQLQFDIYATSAFYFDAVAGASDAFTLSTLREISPYYQTAGRAGDNGPAGE